MDDVIILSSDSDDTDDTDVEFIGYYSDVVPKAEPLPVTALRVDVSAVNVSTLYIDLTDPRWTLPEQKSHKRRNPVDNLADTKVANGTMQTRTNTSQTSNKEDSSGDPPVFALEQDCDSLKTKQRSLDCRRQYQVQTDEAYYCTAIVKLRRLPFLETQVAQLKLPRCSVCVNKDCAEMSMDLRQLDRNSEAPEYISNSVTTTAKCPHMDHSLDESHPKVAESLIKHTQLNAKVSQHLHSSANSPRSDKGGFVATSKDCSTSEKTNDFCSSTYPTSPSSSLDKAQGSLQRQDSCSKVKQLQLNKAGLRQSYHSPNPSESLHLNSLSHPVPGADNFMSQVEPTPAFEQTPTENTDNADEASNSFSYWSIPNEPPLSVSHEDRDDGPGQGANRADLDIDSPVDSSVFFLWQEGNTAEEENKESRFDMDFREASREDRQYVCPVMLRKIMSGQAQALFDEDKKHFGNPEVLCRQSLSLVYSTIDESYPEGTLQLLSDLLQPGYYPPRDITSHLLRGILLNPQCPNHLCVQAFNLLMRTQRHHIADKTTVPWDWELLTSVMANQDHTNRHPCEVVRMVLDYVVQTLEDDFQAKHSISALHHSIAKATLSCDQHFPRIREVIKWLFSAITKSTEHEEKEEQIRMVSILQRMLSLAVEVDRSPALNTAKLSQELFHMLISDVPLRAHRMLLLESLQSKLLRCKLLEHLLDYACPLKIPLPMSLSLLLHFLKYCTLAPDPSDGTDRWQKWEELVHLLWMLLLSYNKTMKGYLCTSVSEHKGRVGNLVYKADDMVSKSAICEAVEAFVLRSQVDLGQALPLHVGESLTYLQDHLLDVCQC